MKNAAREAPLYQAMLAYARENNIMLHMPGHRSGRGIASPELGRAGVLDFTEVPGLDDLHLPAGVIKEAEDLAARAWGAEESLFLVNGATSGIHAMLLTLGENTPVVIPRNVHVSVLEGLVLSGGKPVYVPCQMDPALQAPLAVRPDDVIEAARRSGAKAAFLVSPTYLGTVNKIREIADGLAEARLLVDEAHGGHLAFIREGVPSSCLKEGAAACVQGLHKTLPVLTQAGIIHLGAGFDLAARVRDCRSLVTTTSPSYPLMASIDLGRAVMELYGAELLEHAACLAASCRERINHIPGLRCRTAEFTQLDGVAGWDPLKVLVEITGLDCTGPELARELREVCRIQVEMARDQYLLAMFSPFNDRSDGESLALALKTICARKEKKIRKQIRLPLPPLPISALTPRQAFLGRKKSVTIEESEGMVAAEMAAAYPPGIPCLMPGEVITPEVREYLGSLRSQGVPVHGLSDHSGHRIMVIE